MAIGSAAKKAKTSAANKAKSNAQASVETTAPLEGHAERSATLRLYVKDRELLKQAKLAALQDDTSLSQLWEDWATEWLKTDN
jgi:hypothetical protein